MPELPVAVRVPIRLMVALREHAGYQFNVTFLRCVPDGSLM